MSHRPARSDRKQLSTGQSKTNTGRLVAAIVFCAAAWLLCIFLLPSPKEPVLGTDLALADSKPNGVAQKPSVPTREESSIHLPKETAYTDSSQEKKGLFRDVEKAVETYPNDPKILHIAGLIYAEVQQTERAIEMLKKCNEIDGSIPEVVVGLADLFTQLGKQDEAMVVLEQAISRGVETEPLLSALGEAYSQAGKIEQAVEVLQRAAAIATVEPASFQESKAQLRLAQALTQLGRYDEAEKQARDAVSKQPKKEANYIALSNALMRQNKREEALAIRNQIPKREPFTPADDKSFELSFRGFAAHHYAMLGSAYVAHNSLANAEKMLLRSLELEPESHKTALLLADLLRLQGRTQDAILVYRRLLEIKPDDLINYYNLASLAVSIQDLVLAENALRLATKVDLSGNADLRLAVYLLGVGNKETVSHAKTAVDRLGTIDAYLVLMDASRAFGDTASAYNAYLKAKAIAPNDPRLATFNP